MNNVVNLNKRNATKLAANKSQHVLQLDSPFPPESPLYFEAAETEMMYMCPHMGEEEVKTHKLLVRVDLRDPAPSDLIQSMKKRRYTPLAVVGSNYKIVQNKELFQGVEAQFIEACSPAELKDVRVIDKMAYGGRDCIREYIFPNMRCPFEARTVSDIAFRTIVVNGFGGSSIKLYTGAIDFFCTNGLIIGEYDTSYYRHTKGLQLGDITKRVRQSIDVFYKHGDLWESWMKKELDRERVEQFLKARYSDRMALKLLRQYMIETHQHGRTVWALYSALTYAATHDEGDFAVRKTDNDHTAATMLKREQQVRKDILSPEWIELCKEAA